MRVDAGSCVSGGWCLITPLISQVPEKVSAPRSSAPARDDSASAPDALAIRTAEASLRMCVSAIGPTHYAPADASVAGPARGSMGDGRRRHAPPTVGAVVRSCSRCSATDLRVRDELLARAG